MKSVITNKKIIKISFLLIITCCIAILLNLYQFASADGTPSLKPSDLFIADADVTLTDYAILPDYAADNISRRGKDFPQTDVHGLKMTSAKKEGTSKIQYNNIIDLSSNTISDSLIEFIVVPDAQQQKFDGSNYGDYEFYSIQIKYTDIYDESNYLIVELGVRPDVNYVSAARCGTANQALAGYLSSKMDKTYGQHIRSNFAGISWTAQGATKFFAADFSIDYDTKIIYGYPSNVYGQIPVRDMDDPNHMMENDSIWSGFTTGEVSVSISLTGIAKENASVYILSLNGIDFTGQEIIEDEKPQITLKEAFPETNLPKGEVDSPYRIYNAKAYDNLDGVISEEKIIKKAYFHNNGSKEEVDIIGGYITPSQSGNYSFEYTYTDSLGNTQTEEYVFEVAPKLLPLNLAMQYPIPESLQIGSQFQLPDCVAEYGSGYNTINYTVTKDGKEIETQNDILNINEQGYYIITYTVHDYVYTRSFQYCIKAIYSVYPLITRLPYLPQAVMGNKLITIPDFEAKDYYSYIGEEKDAVKEIWVSENGGAEVKLDSSRTYIVTSTSGYLTVKYKAVSLLNSSIVTEGEDYTFDIPIITPNKVCEYFYDKDNGFNMSYHEFKAMFTTSSDNASLYFINSLPNDSFYFSFMIPSEHNEFEALTFTFEDSLYADEKVFITIEKLDNGNSLISVNDGRRFDIVTPFADDYVFEIEIRNNNILFNDSNICSIDSFASGKAFKGFNNKIYFSLNFSGVGNSAGIILNALYNHDRFNDTASDTVKPMINLNSNIKMIKYIGQIIEIPSATASDVLDPNPTITVSVKKDEKYILKDMPSNIAYTLLAAELGEYIVKYSSRDASGNLKISDDYTVYVMDSIAPIIYLNNIVPSQWELNKSLILPQAVAADNLTTEIKVYLYVKNPNGTFYEVGDDFTFLPDIKGEYTVYYYAKDSSYCYSLIQYVIKVG